MAIYVRGTDANNVRQRIIELVPEGVAVDESAFGKSLEQPSFVKDPKFDTSKKLGARVAKALNESGADVAIVARVNKQRVAHLLVFRRGEAKPELDDHVALGKKSGSDAEKATLAAKLGGAFPSPRPTEEGPAAAKEGSEDDAAEPSPETELEQGPTASAPSKEPGARHPYSRPAFSVGVGVGVGARDFEYENRGTPNLRPYSNSGMALAELDLEGYPLAQSAGALKNLGFTGSLLMALPVKTDVEDGGTASPRGSYFRYSFGLRYQIPVATGSAMFVSAGFIEQTFQFKKSGSLASTVPSVKYRSLEPGLGARIATGPAAVLLGAGYRFPLSGGAVVARFPRASLGAIGAYLGGKLPLGRHWEAQLLARYERYFYSMNATEDDSYVAGGALDQYFTLLGGTAYAF